MLRREFIASTKWLATMPFFSDGIFAEHTLNSLLTDTIQIQIGKYKCTMFRDWMFKYLAKDYFINATEHEVIEHLKKYKVTPDNIPSPFIATLIETPDKKVLIDTGIGYSENPVVFRGNKYSFQGKLQQLLKEYGVKGNEITDVIVTHFHPDHIGGLMSEDGKPNFPNARIHIHEDEWNYWHSPAADNQPPMFKFFIEQNISPLAKSNVNVFSGDFIELVPGVTAVKAQGHTPGQIAVHIMSESAHLLYISDVFLHPLHIERMDWQTNYDRDHDQAQKTRQKLASLAQEKTCW